MCPASLLAWGWSDTIHVGYIIVNGTKIINTTRTSSDDDIGFFIAALSPATCTAGGVANFDPLYVPQDADALAKFLNWLAPETVIVGVTADTATDDADQNLLPVLLLFPL